MTSNLDIKRALGGALLITSLVLAIGTVSADPQPLAADAASLAAGKGKWQSDVVKTKTRDGTAHDYILGIEFGTLVRAGNSNAPDVQAKLFTSTPANGIPAIAAASGSLGDGSFRDVRLGEKDGVRTITITRALPATDPKPEKTRRIFERFYSVSFRYELKNDTLTLKGFPEDKKLDWGVSEFSVSQPEIVFKIVR